jgi:hypothetical protein
MTFLEMLLNHRWAIMRPSNGRKATTRAWPKGIPAEGDGRSGPQARFAGSDSVFSGHSQPGAAGCCSTAVFSLVLRVPVEGGYASFPEFLMAGLLPWMAIQEGVSRSPRFWSTTRPWSEDRLPGPQTLVSRCVSRRWSTG